MATYTAQILVGFREPDCEGIDPTHVLFLSENGRSTWCLYPIFKPGEPFFEKNLGVRSFHSFRRCHANDWAFYFAGQRTN